MVFSQKNAYLRVFFYFTTPIIQDLFMAAPEFNMVYQQCDTIYSGFFFFLIDLPFTLRNSGREEGREGRQVPAHNLYNGFSFFLKTFFRQFQPLALICTSCFLGSLAQQLSFSLRHLFTGVLEIWFLGSHFIFFNFYFIFLGTYSRTYER